MSSDSDSWGKVLHKTFATAFGVLAALSIRDVFNLLLQHVGKKQSILWALATLIFVLFISVLFAITAA